MTDNWKKDDLHKLNDMRTMMELNSPYSLDYNFNKRESFENKFKDNFGFPALYYDDDFISLIKVHKANSMSDSEFKSIESNSLNIKKNPFSITIHPGRKLVTYQEVVGKEAYMNVIPEIFTRASEIVKNRVLKVEN